MSMRRSILFFVAFVLLLGVYTSPLRGQSVSSGTVAGTVTDNTGAIVVGAKVTLIDKSTGDTRTTMSNAEGHYIFAGIVPSSYDIKFTKSGFSETIIANRVVQVGTSLTENVQMKLGAISQTITVTEAAGAELQTMNATVGNTVTGIALESLPAVGRDATTFLELQPGISPDGSVAGAVVDQSTFLLDGGNNTNDMDGSMGVYTPSYASDPTGGLNTFNGQPTGVMPTPLDSVEEFKVNTTNQTADFNSSAGAQVEMVTKRGTNNWHGTAYDYYLDNDMWGNTWQNGLGGTPLPDYDYSRFGVAGGGPVIPKSILGGKTYLFAMYQGFRYPNSGSYARSDPTPGMQLGLLQDGTNVYNLNPYAVTYPSSAPAIGALVPGTTYAGTTIDPRGLGISPTVQQMWNQYEPAVQETGPHKDPNCDQVGPGQLCDGLNEQGYVGTVLTPQTDNFGVVRVDHDFNSKWHFNSSYRYYHLDLATTSQVDIGGFFAGDKLGTPSAVSARPQVPWYYVAGLTTNISSNTTNDFHYSFLRNWWQWGDDNAPPQLPGLGAALEPFGESAGDVLAPFNVNTQNIRTRFWDGKDNMFRDDVTMLHDNHLFQFGGTYQHNWNYHERSDNGGGINFTPVYQLSNGSGTGNADLSSTIPAAWTLPAAQWERDFAVVTGIVTQSQVAYTRQGADLTLNPPLTHAFDKSTIPYYNVYFSDSWHMKPTFTLTYGLGWTLEMPPVEATGKQVELVDQSDQLISAESYLANRKRAALQGQVYNPEIGFALVGNTENGRKYPYNPFYGSFSPRIAAAWNPHFDSDSLAGKMFGHEDTVIRGGYGRVYGRLNGVDLVLVPLLGTGLMQPVQCVGSAFSNGTCGNTENTATPATAFRIGVDGLTAPLSSTPVSATLPQPDFPGYNAASAATAETLDSNFRPNQVDSFDLTIQRQLSRKVTLEVGYIGRRITHEYLPINLNAVPYMMTMGGQQFAQAYKNVVLQLCGGVNGLAGGGCSGASTTAPTSVTPQPFFEVALAGTGYCTGFTSCTQAVVFNEGNPYGPGCPGTSCAPLNPNATKNLTNAQVWTLWSDLDSGPFNFAHSMMNTTTGPFGPQMTSGVGDNASVGFGNYNAGFASVKMADWRGLTMQSNFTWSKALGTAALVQATSEFTPDDPFNPYTMYGQQVFNRKFVYNTFLVYQPPFYKGQHGLIGRALGGWTFSSIFTTGSGSPVEVLTTTGGGQEYGAGDNTNFFGEENAVPLGHVEYGHAYYNRPSSGLPVNFFAQGTAAINDYRNPILGLDNRDGGTGIISGLRYWNMDFSIKKNFRVTEGISLEFQGVFANALNHNQWQDPLANAEAALFEGPSTFGTLGNGSAQAQPGGNRQIELGARVRF